MNLLCFRLAQTEMGINTTISVIKKSGFFYSNTFLAVTGGVLENREHPQGGGGTRYIPGWGGAARPLIP